MTFFQSLKLEGRGENQNGTPERNRMAAFRVSSKINEIQNGTFLSIFHPF